MAKLAWGRQVAILFWWSVKDSIEEQIVALHKEKRDLVDSLRGEKAPLFSCI